MSESIVACENCTYWSGTHCHRNAPTVVVLFNTDGDHGALTSKPWSGWPLVRAGDWCGEFKFDDLKVKGVHA